jgi:hypothetical protein
MSVVDIEIYTLTIKGKLDFIQNPYSSTFYISTKQKTLQIFNNNKTSQSEFFNVLFSCVICCHKLTPSETHQNVP